MTNVYKLSLIGINVADGINRFGGNKSIYEKYLEKFVSDPNYALLCKAIKEKNVVAAFNASHALKGVAGNLSITKLYNDISPLVEELRSGSLLRAEELLAPVELDYNTIIEALK